MSRAEHLATLGELAAGLAHEMQSPGRHCGGDRNRGQGSTVQQPGARGSERRPPGSRAD
jgi:hypothetical protein